MKNLKLILGNLFFFAFLFSAAAQNPAANFVPKDPAKDNLLTGENTVLLVIDWQQDLINIVQNIDQDIMMNNIEAMVKTANLFGVPVIESFVGIMKTHFYPFAGKY